MIKPSSYTYRVLDYKVIDGDTIRCWVDLVSTIPDEIVEVDLGFDISAQLKVDSRLTKEIDVRIEGINTPEKRGDEKIAGIPVTIVVKMILYNLDPLGGYRVRSNEWGKFAGRCIGDVISVSMSAKSEPIRRPLSDMILDMELAKPYRDADGERTTYTQEELIKIRQQCHDLLLPSFLDRVTTVGDSIEISPEIYEDPAGYLSEFGLEYGYLDDELNPTDKLKQMNKDL